MFLYNVSLSFLFWVLFSFITTKFKTLYNFANLAFKPFQLFSIIVLIFSMAGVPPFIGFFSKIFILMLILSNSFFLFYIVFILLLLLGLYFYIQNVRFLLSSNFSTIQSSFLENTRFLLVQVYFTVFFLHVLIFGFTYIDDLLLFFSWLL